MRKLRLALTVEFEITADLTTGEILQRANQYLPDELASPLIEAVCDAVMKDDQTPITIELFDMHADVLELAEPPTPSANAFGYWYAGKRYDDDEQEGDEVDPDFDDLDDDTPPE